MLWKGIGKRLSDVFQARDFNDGFFEQLEDAMIEADMGVHVAAETVEALRLRVRTDDIRDRARLIAALKELLRESLVPRRFPFVPGT